MVVLAMEVRLLDHNFAMLIHLSHPVLPKKAFGEVVAVVLVHDCLCASLRPDETTNHAKRSVKVMVTQSDALSATCLLVALCDNKCTSGAGNKRCIDRHEDLYLVRGKFELHLNSADI